MRQVRIPYIRLLLHTLSTYTRCTRRPRAREATARYHMIRETRRGATLDIECMFDTSTDALLARRGATSPFLQSKHPYMYYKYTPYVILRNSKNILSTHEGHLAAWDIRRTAVGPAYAPNLTRNCLHLYYIYMEIPRSCRCVHRTTTTHPPTHRTCIKDDRGMPGSSSRPPAPVPPPPVGAGAKPIAPPAPPPPPPPPSVYCLCRCAAARLDCVRPRMLLLR